MRYQIVYCKRGLPLTTWANTAASVIPWTCGSTPPTDRGKPTFDPRRML